MADFNITTTGLIFVLVVCGCSSQSTTRPSPSYAVPSERGWQVRCDFNSVQVNDFDTKAFYKADGTLKDKKEFCSEQSTIKNR